MSELQHPDARSFERVASLYERVRPEYPAEAVAWLADQLGLGPARTVLDLGAGTGKLTRQLLATGAEVIAVEPGEAMLAELRRAVPSATAIHGSAEAIPLEDHSVDAVTAGQAFHWFRFDEALAEIGRVLRPGAGLGLLWNVRDPDDPVQAQVSALLEPFVPPDRPALPTTVTDFIAERFGKLASHVVPFEQELDADGVAERILSTSFVAAAPDAERAELVAAMRALVVAHGGRVSFRYRAEAFVVFNVA